MSIVWLVLGLGALVKGADWLVDGASSLAKRLRISSLVIGLTVVAFGTSAPEFIVSFLAAIQGNSDIAIGNILGSNIANILFILGISALIYPLAAKRSTVLKEIPFSLLAAVSVGVMANDKFFDGANISVLSRSDALILMFFFIIFMYYTLGMAKSEVSDEPGTETVRPIAVSALLVFIGLAALVFGGKLVVDSAISLASVLGVSQSLIALTVVAMGTSLPELATSAVAAYKKQADIAIGNVVGSNIFNVFWILGASALVRPLPFNDSNNVDVIAAISASLILFAIMYVGRRHIIERWQGAAMVMAYVFYVSLLLVSQA